jgi:hypothetical protein
VTAYLIRDSGGDVFFWFGGGGGYVLVDWLGYVMEITSSKVRP